MSSRKPAPQELTVDRLSALLSQAKVPVTTDIARAITNVWVDYELLGAAAAHDDSLSDPKLIDNALWPIIAQMRAGKWHDEVVKTFHIDTSASGSEVQRRRRARGAPHSLHGAAGRHARAERFDSQGRRGRPRTGDVVQLHPDGAEVHAGAGRRAARRRPRRVPEGRDGAAVRAGRRRAQAGSGIADREDAVRLSHHPALHLSRSRGRSRAARERTRAAGRRQRVRREARGSGQHPVQAERRHDHQGRGEGSRRPPQRQDGDRDVQGGRLHGRASHALDRSVPAARRSGQAACRARRTASC